MSQIRPFLEITTTSNGNQTRDMSRGVTDVNYNALNLPRRVEFDGGGHIEYLYSATGTKLAERVYDADGTLIARRDYVGQFEFVADTLERTLLPEGFITEADGTFHAFIPDHQGNITGVYNSATNALEQFTDYYPYGLPHASATSPETNRRKYGAKELTTDHGLNLYDFAARFQNPAFPHFTTPDPLAEKYFAISPYAYCAADPINLVDPTGMTINTDQMTDEQKEIWNQCVELFRNRSSLFQVLYDFLDQSSDVVYVMFGSTTKNDGSGNGGEYNPDNKTIKLPFNVSENGTVVFGEAEISEELFHAYQDQNPELYKDLEINMEFEAKTFKKLVNSEAEFGYSGFQDKAFREFGENIDPLYKYGEDIVEISKQILDNNSTFNNDFIFYANKFAHYCKQKFPQKINYHSPTSSVPKGIQNIIIMTLKHH